MAEILSPAPDTDILSVQKGDSSSQIHLHFRVQLTPDERTVLTTGAGGIINLAVRLKGEDGPLRRDRADEYLFFHQQAIAALSPQLQAAVAPLAEITSIHCQFEVPNSTLNEDQGGWIPGGDRDEIYAQFRLSLTTDVNAYGQEITPWIRTNLITDQF